jgi:hypothetical protein
MPRALHARTAEARPPGCVVQMSICVTVAYRLISTSAHASETPCNRATCPGAALYSSEQSVLSQRPDPCILHESQWQRKVLPMPPNPFITPAVMPQQARQHLAPVEALKAQRVG